MTAAFQNWLNFRRDQPPRKTGRRTKAAVVAQVSILEPRIMLSAVSWVGGVDNNWSTAGNWSGGVVPSATSDVTINAAGTTINGPSGSTTINSLTIQSGKLQLATGSSNSLTVTNGTTVDASASLVTNSAAFNSSISGTGGIDLSGSTVNLGAQDIMIGGASPSLTLSNTTLDGAGTLTVANGATLNVVTCTINVGVVNQGTINAWTEGGASVMGFVTTFNGAFSNQAGATFNVPVNTSGNGSFAAIAQGFNNDGTISIESGNGVAGTLNVTTGTLVNASGGLITFTSADIGNTPSTINANLLNQGTIDVPAGQTYDVSPDKTWVNTGSLTGPGTINFYTCTDVDLGNFTVTSSSTPLVFDRTTLVGSGQLTISSTGNQTFQGGTINVPVENQGTMNLTQDTFLGSGGSFNNTFDNAAGASLNVIPNALGKTGQFTFANGFTNAGTITLESTSQLGATLTISAGTLTNAATGVITFTCADSSNTPSTIAANVLNQGTINIPAGQTYVFNNSNGGDNNSFANTGSLTGAGTLNFFNCSNVDLGNLTVTSSTPAIILDRTTLVGSGTFTISSTGRQTFQGGTIGVPVVNQGTMNVTPDSYLEQPANFNSTFSNAAGANLNLLPDVTGHAAQVVFANGFTNAGTISLSSSNSNGGSLNVNSGTLTTAVGGVVNINGTNGIDDNLNGNFANLGTINLNTGLGGTWSLNNTGTLNVAQAQPMGFTQLDALGNVAFNGTGTASAPQILTAPSSDLGATSAGFTNNSVFGSLALANNTYVTLQGTPGTNAVYAGSLTVPVGTTLNLNGLNLYAETMNVNGTITGGTVTTVGPHISVTSGATDLSNGTSIINFGTTAIGNSVSKTVTVTNNGSAALVVQPVTAPAGFTITDNFTANQSIAVGASASFTIAMTATAVGNPSGTVVIGDNDAISGTFAIGVSGSVSGISPTNLALSSTTIVDSQPAGSTVGQFTTTEAGTGHTYTYALASGGDNGEFSIDANGNLKTVFFLDAAEKSSYVITVTSTDENGLSITKQFTITVTGTGPAPANSTIMDDSGPGFSTTGTWTKATGAGFDNEYLFAPAGSGSDQATWSFSGLTAGQYVVSVTYLQYANRATNAPYTILDSVGGTVLATSTVNQQKAPSSMNDNGASWQTIGTVNVVGSTLIVQLNNKAGNYVIADAVQIQRVGDVPQTTVADGTVNIANNLGVDNFGTVAQGASGVTKTYTITNNGDSNLILQPATITSDSGFSIESNFTAGQIVTPGGTATLTVQMGTSTVGALSGTVSFTSNDSSNSPFTFTVNGTVTGIIMDDSGPGFSTTGTWTKATGAGFDNEYLFAPAGSGSDQATWNFSGLTAGQYVVSVTYLQYANRATNAPYTILDSVGGTVLATSTVNQQKAPSSMNDNGASWQTIGTVNVVGSTLIVQLNNKAGNYVIADAVQIQRLGPVVS